MQTFIKFNKVIVADNKLISSFCFDTPGWRDLDFRFCELTTNHRQQGEERDFVDCLHKVREGKDVAQAISYINSHATKIARNRIPDDVVALCPFNKTADEINDRKMREIPEQEYHYLAEIEGNPDKSLHVPNDLVLKPGAQVIATANDPQGYFSNGSVGRVVECCEDTVMVAFEDVASFQNPVAVSYNTWETNDYQVVEKTVAGQKVRKLKLQTVGTTKQIPLRPGWAVTIHKAQGRTLPKAAINPGFFANGQLYVALSRLTGMRGLYITQELAEKDCMTSERAVAFYKNGGASPEAPLTGKAQLFIMPEDLDLLDAIGARFDLPNNLSPEERYSEILHRLILEAAENESRVEQDQDAYEQELASMLDVMPMPAQEYAGSGFRRFLRH